MLSSYLISFIFFFFKQKTAYEIGLGIPAEPLFRSRRFMIIPMLCVTIFVILVVWFLLPRVARLMIHTPTAISIFCVPEYGTANGRLHFHAVHFMRTLPTGSVDPNFGRRVRNRRQLNSLQNTWPYGYSMPIAVRYTQDAFSRSGWLWPVDAKGEPLKATSYMAVGFYVAKYVNKKSDM